MRFTFTRQAESGASQNVTETLRERRGLNLLPVSHLYISVNTAESRLPCSVSADLRSNLTGSPWRPLTHTHVRTHAHLWELSENNGVWHYLIGLYPQNAHTDTHWNTHAKTNQSQRSLSASRGLPHPGDVWHKARRAPQLSICPTRTHSHCMYTSHMKHLDCKSLFVYFWHIKAFIIQTRIQSQCVGALAGECNQLFFLFSALSSVRSLQQ